MSNPLSPVNVYVPVSISGTISVCYFDDNTASFKHKQEVEEQSKYVFSREELEMLLESAFNAGEKWGVNEAVRLLPDGKKIFGIMDTTNPCQDNTEYIQSLF